MAARSWPVPTEAWRINTRGIDPLTGAECGASSPGLYRTIKHRVCREHVKLAPLCYNPYTTSYDVTKIMVGAMLAPSPVTANQESGRVVQSLLPLKLTPPPPREGGLLRPDLQALLPEIRLHPLTLVIAPAGYGKTTLL